MSKFRKALRVADDRYKTATYEGREWLATPYFVVDRSLCPGTLPASKFTPKLPGIPANVWACSKVRAPEVEWPTVGLVDLAYRTAGYSGEWWYYLVLIAGQAAGLNAAMFDGLDSLMPEGTTLHGHDPHKAVTFVHQRKRLGFLMPGHVHPEATDLLGAMWVTP